MIFFDETIHVHLKIIVYSNRRIFLLFIVANACQQMTMSAKVVKDLSGACVKKTMEVRITSVCLKNNKQKHLLMLSVHFT